MSTFAISHGLHGLVRLLTTVVAAGWVSSPMSWSPDSRWLSYTTAPAPGTIDRDPGWLFDGARGEPAGGQRDARVPVPARGDDRPGMYRVWASRRDRDASVLIEESTWPMTSPAWSPRGRTIAFGRFVPESTGQKTPMPRGHFEVVIQDALNRKRMLYAQPDFELDEAARAPFPHVGPAWSPDGQYLAFPRPGRVPTILIIKVDSHKLVRTLEHALLPAWSPDGQKLAFLREDIGNSHSLQVLERNGQTFTGERAIMPMGRVAAPVAWGEDGRSITALAEKTGLRFPDLDLITVNTVTNEDVRILSLAPEAVRRGAPIRGVAIDYSRDEDLCFFSLDFEGRDTQVMWIVPRDRLPYKPFHPLDQSIRVGGLSIAPDGHSVAMRFGTPGPGGLSPPAIYDLPTEQSPERTTLLVPDESARRAWLDLLIGTSRKLLISALPPAMVDGQPAGRPTLLPLPVEVPDLLRRRLAKLGRHGSTISLARRDREALAAEPEDEDQTKTDREDRLFFDYLRGDYTAAMADLEALETRVTTRAQRLALLSLKAQVLWSRGDTDRARDVADYLLEAAGGPVHRYEETPLGRSLTPESGSGRSWARYLSTMASQPPPPAVPSAEPPAERDDIPPNPFAQPEMPEIRLERRRGAAVPFAPN